MEFLKFYTFEENNKGIDFLKKNLINTIKTIHQQDLRLAIFIIQTKNMIKQKLKF